MRYVGLSNVPGWYVGRAVSSQRAPGDPRGLRVRDDHDGTRQICDLLGERVGEVA